ncbi:MAG: hypothetical protein ACYDAE_02590 [Steroidobacteraceae bacterium]
MKDKASRLLFAHLQAFLDETNGQITLGEIPPIRSAALAAVGKRVRVALLRRDDENLGQLLERLDAALGKVMADDSVVDEVLPEIKRRRSR